MSGCYDNDYYGYEQSYEYNDCYKPRHRRHHRRQYEGCWDYSYCN